MNENMMEIRILERRNPAKKEESISRGHAGFWKSFWKTGKSQWEREKDMAGNVKMPLEGLTDM